MFFDVCFSRPIRQAFELPTCLTRPRAVVGAPSLTYSSSVVTFIETKLFTRLVGEYMSDEEYLQLQAALAENPEAGAVIPESGGIRKLRWGLPGRDKRGGLRVIYYVRSHRGTIWMFPSHVLRQIRKEIEDD